MLYKDEHIEYLNEKTGLIVSPAHTFGTDALLLASFSSPKRKDKALDLGTGCGIIPFYWLRYGVSDISALELQERAYDQLVRSVALNKLQDTIKTYNLDLRDIKGKLPFGYYDLVSMNPPYNAEGSGVLSNKEPEKIARHATLCSLADLSLAANKLLRFGGRLCICIRPERLADSITEMKNHGIEPKRMRLVAGRAGKPPWLLLLEGRRGGKPGMELMPNLYIEGEFDGYSEEMRNIIGSYYEGKNTK